MKKILFSMAMLVLTTVAFSQQCARVNSAVFSGPFSDPLFPLNPPTYDLSIIYSTTGNKTLETVIYCSGTQIFLDCFTNNITNGAKVYTVSCPGGIASLSAIFTPKTGSCNAANCGTITQSIPTGGGLLPVKLSSLSADRSKQIVSLTWNTEYEINLKEFIVERAEGTEFRSVGTITGNGNSNTNKSYSFNDKNENTGVTYYRLKNVDLNGKLTYSEIKTVKGFGTASDVSVFPNPARSNSIVSVVGVTANSFIQLLDFSGKVLKNINSSSVNSVDLSGVKNGFYLMKIIDKSTHEVINKKLTVSN